MLHHGMDFVLSISSHIPHFVKTISRQLHGAIYGQNLPTVHTGDVRAAHGTDRSSQG
jgi:hypothetical protein